MWALKASGFAESYIVLYVGPEKTAAHIIPIPIIIIIIGNGSWQLALTIRTLLVREMWDKQNVVNEVLRGQTMLYSA